MKKNIITFDVMLKGRFVCTMRMPVTFDMVLDYDGDTPVIDARAITRYVEQKRPSLAGSGYNICF